MMLREWDYCWNCGQPIVYGDSDLMEEVEIGPDPNTGVSLGVEHECPMREVERDVDEIEGVR